MTTALAPNRLLQVSVADLRLSPTGAELLVSARPLRPAPGLELRGRLVGPVSDHASTVEVSYPLRPAASGDPTRVRATVVIPEPGLWTPAGPLLYRGPVQLWHEGRQIDERPVMHGLRRIAATTDGLWCNGEVLRLRARPATGTEPALVRRDGYTALWATADRAEGFADAADRAGVFLLAELPADPPAWAGFAERLRHRACALAFVLPRGAADRGRLTGLASVLGGAALVGLRLDAPPPGPLPDSVSLVVGPAGVLAAVPGPPPARLVVGDGPTDLAGAIGTLEAG